MHWQNGSISDFADFGRNSWIISIRRPYAFEKDIGRQRATEVGLTNRKKPAEES